MKVIVYSLIMLFSSFSFSQDLCAAKHTSICFATPHSSFCKEGNYTRVVRSSTEDIADRIFFMQDTIRQTLNDVSTENLVLLAEGFDATLLFMAQHNLLFYYRKNIKGLVLKKPFANLYKMCIQEKDGANNKTCQSIHNFYTKLNGKASTGELLKALSPVLQIDKYEPKVVLLDSNDAEEKRAWKKAFKENVVKHQCLSKHKIVDFRQYFPLKKSTKIQPKKNLLKKPNYVGPILTFHLGKILYQSYHTLKTEENISYGEDPLQTYDIYYDANITQKRPLFVYVHGGGWQGGDKQYFRALCRQYADKGYVAITVNYRLLYLPKVSIEMMIEDIAVALEEILSKDKVYHFDRKHVTVMGDSSGSQLLFMAITELPPKAIDKAIFNTIPTAFMFYSAQKRERLTGEKDPKLQEEIFKSLSPLFHLKYYHPKTLVIQVLNDTVVKAKHVELLEIQSVIHYNTIQSLWIADGVHPTSPKEKSLQPNYSDISQSIEDFLNAHD